MDAVLESTKMAKTYSDFMISTPLNKRGQGLQLPRGWGMDFNKVRAALELSISYNMFVHVVQELHFLDVSFCVRQ